MPLSPDRRKISNEISDSLVANEMRLLIYGFVPDGWTVGLLFCFHEKKTVFVSLLLKLKPDCLSVWYRSGLICVKIGWQKSKAKAYDTYIAPRAASCSCSGAFVSQTEWTYSQSKPARAHGLWPATKQLYAALHNLPFNGLHPVMHVINGLILTPLPTSEGWKAELACLSDPQQTV